MSISTKIGLAEKGHDMTDCSSLHLQRKIELLHLTFNQLAEMDISTVSITVLESLGKFQTWKNECTAHDKPA